MSPLLTAVIRVSFGLRVGLQLGCRGDGWGQHCLPIWGTQHRLQEGVEMWEVVGNEADGPNGARAHIDGHVFLHAHPLSPTGWPCTCHGGPDIGTQRSSHLLGAPSTHLLRAVSHCFAAAGSRCRVTEPEVNHLSKCVTEQGGDQEPWGPSLVSCLCPLHSIHTLLKGAIFTTIMCLLLGKEAAGLEVTKGVCWGG